MPKYKTFAARMEANKGTCTALGCNLPRFRVGAYCQSHAIKVNRWGHPSGRAVREQEMARERETVEAFLSKHKGHPATVAACKFFDDWMSKAVEGKPDVVGLLHLQRLQAHGVTSMELAVRAASVFRWFRNNPRALDDGDCLTMNIGNHLLRAAHTETLGQRTSRYGRTYKNRRKPTPADRRAVGRYVRGALSGFLANVAAGIDAEVTATLTERASLNTPF